MAKKKQEFDIDDLLYAYSVAADCIDNEEWAEDDGGKQVAAYREVAKRLRRTATRVWIEYCKKNIGQ